MLLNKGLGRCLTQSALPNWMQTGDEFLEKALHPAEVFSMAPDTLGLGWWSWGGAYSKQENNRTFQGPLGAGQEDRHRTPIKPAGN